MLRAIFRREVRDHISGATYTTHGTLLFDCAEMERRLRYGGYGDGCFGQTELVGIELVDLKDEEVHACGDRP